MNYDQLTHKKQELDKYRPLTKALVHNLNHWFRIELTYTSNAIEGNTLTRQETALVVEKGITIGGKSIADHLEAINHATAFDWIQSLVHKKPQDLTEHDLLHLHSLILKSIDDMNAGYYRSVSVRISGSQVIPPNARKVPDLMAQFIKWLHHTDMPPVRIAAEAHYELVTIHPLVDGNGRTARLLMNLILMLYGYPPAIIRKKDRLAYIGALEKAQLGGSKEAYFDLIGKAVGRSLDIYLKVIKGEEPIEDESVNHPMKFLKIGELAKAVHETVSTIRYWTTEGLLEVADTTAAGYQLYDPTMIKWVQHIKSLKAKRYTLDEIKKHITYAS